MEVIDRLQEARRQRLVAWLESHGGAAQVIRDRGLKPSDASYVSQLAGGYSFGERAARNWEVKLGMPRMHLDEGVAHTLSPLPFETPSLTMEEVMRLRKEARLPREFELAIPDASLGPDVPKGTLYVWSVEREPTPERLVLVLDKYGKVHARHYELGAEPGAWRAVAARGYPDFDGADVTLLAVSRFRET